MRYEDAAAFRAALAANLRNQYPDKDLNRLQKRAMMERFLARTSTALPDQAILKGGYALELRLHQARTTQDLDLSIRDLPANEVVEALLRRVKEHPHSRTALNQLPRKLSQHLRVPDRHP